ncbi:MAG: hypothetical protein WBE41_24500 [Terracidiphilus sp.]
MSRMAVYFIWMIAALPLFAQSIAQVSPGVMEFRDPANGVRFRYPEAWTFTHDEPFMFAPSIAKPGPTPRTLLRGLVVARSIPGIPSWPVADFSGVEFDYDARPAVSDAACRAVLGGIAGPASGIDRAAFDGIVYWHRTAGDGGMSKYTSEEIYATYSRLAGSCLLFDLAVHSTYAPGAQKGSDAGIVPRALSPRESATVRQSLMQILSSVRISAPRR